MIQWRLLHPISLYPFIPYSNGLNMYVYFAFNEYTIACQIIDHSADGYVQAYTGWRQRRSRALNPALRLSVTVCKKRTWIFIFIFLKTNNFVLFFFYIFLSTYS